MTAVVLAASIVLLGARADAAEPWTDPDPASPPTRYELGKLGLRAGAEYRAQWTYVNPIALNTESSRRISFIDHRLRLDAGVDYLDKVRLFLSTDVLDGTVWGDNGTYGETPGSNSGANVSTKGPNITRPCVTARSGDPLDAESYGYGLCSQDVLTIRKLYADAVLPFGLLRFGRQPMNEGMGVQATDGDGRRNRFGVARSGNMVDRIQFATKPLEALKPDAQRNRSEREGFFVGATYDRLVTDSPHLFGDDVHQVSAGVRLVMPKHPLGRDLWASSYYVHRWDAQYETAVNSIGVRVYSSFGPLHAGFDVVTNLGTTREVAEAYRVVVADPVVDQTIRQIGARAVVRFDQRFWSAYLEADYASGDFDPQARTPLTQFVFSEDTNVGLLLFEHVLAFQTARAAAAANETLRRLGAESYPAEAIATRGAFTNAFALFPQFDFRPHPTVLLRGGVLLAWAAEPVVDPVASLLARDGVSIDDDLVNFAGGKPARHLGTELDARAQWRFLDHFALDMEGAILFPGEALEDEDGYAVRSVLVQGRGTVFF